MIGANILCTLRKTANMAGGGARGLDPAGICANSIKPSTIKVPAGIETKNTDRIGVDIRIFPNLRKKGICGVRAPLLQVHFFFGKIIGTGSMG